MLIPVLLLHKLAACLRMMEIGSIVRSIRTVTTRSYIVGEIKVVARENESPYSPTPLSFAS